MSRTTKSGVTGNSLGVPKDKPDWMLRLFLVLSISAMLGFAVVRAWEIGYEQQASATERP